MSKCISNAFVNHAFERRDIYVMSILIARAPRIT